MNANVELLNYIYQNSQMGIETINQLLGIAKDETFRKHLEFELAEYEKINISAKELLNKHDYDEKGIGTLNKITTYLMINMKTLTNKTASHIAEMMIIGSNMGITEAIKDIRKYEGEAEKDILNLMKKLLKFEEENVEKLKSFL